MRHKDYARRKRHEDASAADIAAPSEDEATIEIDKILAHLPSVLFNLCELIYKSGMTIEVAARTLGYSAKYGHILHKRAIGTLRERLRD